MLHAVSMRTSRRAALAGPVLVAGILIVPSGSLAASDYEGPRPQSLASELVMLRPSPLPPPAGWRNTCGSSAADLCYDRAERRIVYRPAREYMPRFDGLTAENVSLRRNGIQVKYSFR